MSEATWRDLGYLESRDLASALYSEAHGRNPTAAKSHSIVAAFAQGRRYVEAAATADFLVRPPLLLYGVIALSRGLTLFLDSSRGEEALSPAHGVHPQDWAGTLGTPGTGTVEKLVNLRATFARGTFTEVLHATKNLERGDVVVQPPDESLQATSTGTSDLDEVVMTFGDVLARVPDLAVTYARTFGNRGRCLPARVTYRKASEETKVDVLPTAFLGLPTEDEVRDAFTLPPWVAVGVLPFESVLQPGQTSVQFVIPHPNEADLEAVPYVAQTADGRTFVVTHKPNEPRMSLLLTLYLAAFFTGTLARYYPSIWLSIQTPGKGDALTPIIREAVSTVQLRFPELVMREIRHASPGSLVGNP